MNRYEDQIGFMPVVYERNSSGWSMMATNPEKKIDVKMDGFKSLEEARNFAKKMHDGIKRRRAQRERP